MASPEFSVPSEQRPSLLRQIFNYLWRATWWKCPVCGTKPVFLPLSKIRSLRDWFTPLDGCPRCGYPYDREPGYFLMAQWGIGYGVAAVVSIFIYVYLQVWHSDLSFTKTLLIVMIPLPIINMIFARHAKTYFLAIDHLFDPHIPLENEEGGGSGGGDGGSPKSPLPPDDPSAGSSDPAGQPGSGIAREKEGEEHRQVEKVGTR